MTKFFAELLVTLGLAIYDRAAKGPEYVKGKGPGKREKRLLKKIDKIKKHISVVLLCVLITIPVFVGCGNKVIMIRDDQAFQLAED